MSGDEYFLDDFDESSWLEPTSVADELVERTFHSPVYISYDQALDFLEGYDSDAWDSDDDFEGDASVHSGSHRHRKRTVPHGLASESECPAAGRVRIPIVWKSSDSRSRSPDVPLLHDGQGEEVSLLKDWRNRLETFHAIGSVDGKHEKAQQNSQTLTGDEHKLLHTTGNGLLIGVNAAKTDHHDLVMNVHVDAEPDTQSHPSVTDESSADLAAKDLDPPATSDQGLSRGRKRKASEAIENTTAKKIDDGAKRGGFGIPTHGMRLQVGPGQASLKRKGEQKGETVPHKKASRGRPRKVVEPLGQAPAPKGDIAPRKTRSKK